MKFLKRHLINIILVVLSVNYIYNHFYNNYQINNLYYGIKANNLRASINVPIIDEYMSINHYEDSFWKTEKEIPEKGETLHIWKYVASSTKKLRLDEEADGFLKLGKDERLMQLNIFSTIIGDSISKRKGKLFYRNSKPRTSIEINELQLDSIASSWNLNYLIRE